MSHRDHDNAVSALVAIQLQISATIHGEQDPLQSLANIGHIFNKPALFMDLPNQNIEVKNENGYS